MLLGLLNKACQQGGQYRKRSAALIEVVIAANNGELTCLPSFSEAEFAHVGIDKRPRNPPCFSWSCRPSLPEVSLLHASSFTPFARLYPLYVARNHILDLLSTYHHGPTYCPRRAAHNTTAYTCP
jgi:hypothetical protein